MATIIRPSLKTPAANKGAASIIYFNYGNAPSETLVQETLKLKKGMENYNYTVLLKYEELPNWADLSQKDEKLANVKAEPTKTNLFKYIIQLAEDGYYIDLFLFCHGWEGKFGRLNSSTTSENSVTEADIQYALHPSRTGFTQMPIRAIWGTNCYGQTLGETWRSIGAKATAGARFVRFYPNAWGNFIDDWNKGNVPFRQAVHGADTDAVRTVVQSYISLIDAPSKKKAGKWDGCKFGKTVLGDDPCAKDYFVSCWLAKDEWQTGQSGKENMNYSSYMFCGGEKEITKNTRLTWA
ncbi:MAG: hypothetical protein R3C14_54760 [Caldilineaceae bacterium]